MKTEGEKVLGRVFRSWEEPAPEAVPVSSLSIPGKPGKPPGDPARRESFPWATAAAALLVLAVGSWGLTQQRGLPPALVENSRRVGQELFGPKTGEALLQGIREYWNAPVGKGERT